jgi:hypothetical protein
MAHEAAHVVQQAGGSGGAQLKADEVVPVNDPAELEADRVADAVTSGDAMAPRAGLTSGLVALTRIPSNRVARNPHPANTVTTPTAAPGPNTPESGPTEQRTDAEGNKIAQGINGVWYLSELPAHLAFPHAAGDFHLYPINPNTSFSALRAAVVQAQHQQLETANSLKPDMKYWFAKVYYFVTTHELEAIDNGIYQYPHMKMQEVLSFNNTYRSNLQAWQDGNQSMVESHWRAAFAAAESENDGTWWRTHMFEIVHALLPSMQAHIRFDLPRAIAACYQTHYAGIPGASIGSFRADFEAMGPVFAAAQADLRPEIGDETWFGGNATLQDIGMAFRFDVTEQRRMTWEKTEALVSAQDRGADVNQAIHGTIDTAHPNSGSDAFDVDGDTINDFDWNHQPGMMADVDDAGDAVWDPAPAMPAFPERLYFKQGLPHASEPLERAIRDDQDLAPYRDLALWTDRVRGAIVRIDGHASIEGHDIDNAALSVRRANLVDTFMTQVGADVHLNTFIPVGLGVEGSTIDPQYRYARLAVDASHATAKTQHYPQNGNLPSEVNPNAHTPAPAGGRPMPQLYPVHIAP